MVSSGDKPVPKFVDGHEGSIYGADVNAAHGNDAPARCCPSSFDGNAIVAAATCEIAKPLLDAKAPSVDAMSGGAQRPDLAVLAHEHLQLLQAAPVEGINGA